MDIASFTREFVRLREQRAIPAGRYDGPVATAGGRGGPGSREPGPSNPLLPGQSPNQTKSGVGRRAGERKVPPQGYRMPAEAETRLFEEIMQAAYLLDVLVEDHFDAYARPQRSNPSVRTLGVADFQDAVQRLALRWSARDSERVFAWIDDAFNARPAGQLEPRQID